jgi:hypothetical protein
LPVAPSAIAPAGHPSLLRPARPFVTPRALDREEIPGVVATYRLEDEDDRHRLDGGVGEGMMLHPGDVAQGEAGGRRITATLRRRLRRGTSRHQETKPAQDEQNQARTNEQ